MDVAATLYKLAFPKQKKTKPNRVVLGLVDIICEEPLGVGSAYLSLVVLACQGYY